MSYNRKLLKVDNRTSEMKNPNRKEQSKIENELPLQPYSGQYQFDTNQVLEEKMKCGGKMKEGGWLDNYQTGGAKQIEPEKALAILNNGSVYGKPLTQKQYDYFMQVAKARENEEGEYEVIDEDLNNADTTMLMKYGGWLKKYSQLKKNPKKTTHLNIQSSVNEMFLRNETLYGPGGLRRYLPKAEFGGWLEEYQKGGYTWSDNQPITNKLETPTSNYKGEALEQQRLKQLELEKLKQLEAVKEVKRIAAKLNATQTPVYGQPNNASIQYGQTDLRRIDAVDPNNRWMYPQLSDESNRSMGDFSLEMVGASLPIPGIESMGKIPGIGKPVKNMLENLPDRSHSFFKPSEYSKIDWGKEWFSKIDNKQEELHKLYQSEKIDWDELKNLEKVYKTTLAKELGLGNQIGKGAYGEVYEILNDPSNLIKLGDNFKSKWTPELIEKSKPINVHKNIAIPERAEYYEIPFHNSSNTRTKEVLFMPNLNKTVSENLNLNKRDAYAMFLKQTRKLRDNGIEVDADNYANFKFNKDKGIFDIYDINPNSTSSYYMNWVKDKTSKMLRKKGGQINWLNNY